MSIYERINYLCKLNELTGTELGIKLGLKKSPLTDWKNKQAKPTVDQIILMCDIFATTSEYILFGKETGALTENEQELLNAYRRATSNVKEAMLTSARLLAPDQDESSTLRTG